MSSEGIIGIVGAGVAGLACAAALSKAGRPVRVFEKSKGLGGRLATRRSDAGSFDHGPPGFTVTDPAFRAVIEAAVAAGHAAPWPDGAEALLCGGPGDAFVGVPGSSGFARHLCSARSEAAIALGSEVNSLLRTPDGWAIPAAEGTMATLVLAIPAPQAARLLATTGPLAGLERFLYALDEVAFAPRLTAMLGLETSLGMKDQDSPVIAKAIRQNSVPGREGPGERWVLHATEAWSRTHLDREKPWIADAMIEAFTGMAGPLPGESYRAGHRWRYALTARPLGQSCLWDPQIRLALCGDWCLGDSVEDAWHSGRAAAAAILGA